MIDDIHNDGKDLNDSTIRQFEDYLDVNQNYNNFLPIAEFHDTYEEFPTVYHENVVQEPKKKKEEKKKEQKRESDSSSDNSSGSSDASSSGPTGAESSAGASAGASSSSALADLSASQVLSTTFVTMVAVTAVVVPIIENADLEVDLDVDYNAGILTYMIELINASDGSDYYAVVMEGQTVILQQQIFDNYQSNTITDLRNSQEHRVEVRTGTPPLYVLDSVIIPATPSWAEWGHLTVSYNSIDYGVYFHGDSGEAVLKLTDTNSGEILYTKDLVDGLNSDVIGDLFSSHLYTLTVETETDTLLIRDIQTEYRDVSWNHLTVVDNVIDYGVEVNLGDVDVTISLYDPSTSSVLYSMDLMQGYNADVIRDLEYNHTYELTVASADETFLFETLTTDSEPIEVTVGHLTPKDNTIDYELIVSGEGKTVTLNIYDAAGGPSVYTASLTSGSNTGIIEGLEYSHSYLLTVSSASKTYLSESVTTEAEPTKVTLDSLTSTETSIQYKVTVTGDRDTVTAYLKDPTSGETLYSKELTVGANTAVIEELEPGYTYQFTVSSKTATYVSKEITTGSHPVEVTLNHLTPSDNTIDYEVTVTGNSEVVTVYLYDAEGEEVYSKVLSEGTNPEIIKDLKYDYTYQFTISSETQIYVSEEVAISASIIVESLAADGLIINYTMTLNGTEDAIITLYREEGDLEIESAELPAGKTTSRSFKGTGDRPIEPNKEYYVIGYIGEKEYELGSITTELRVVTKELMSDGNFIRFKVEVYESAGSNMYVYIYDSNGEPLKDEELPAKYEIKGDPEIIGDIIGNHPYIPWGDTYTLKAEIDGQTYLIGEVRVEDAPSFEAEGNSIKYRFIMNDFGYRPFLTFKSETGGSAELYLDITSDGKYSGTITKIGKDFEFKWNTTYTVTITEGGGEFYKCQVNTESVKATISDTTSGDSIEAEVTFENVSDFEKFSIRLYADWNHQEEIIDTEEDPSVPSSPVIKKYTGLESDHEYYLCILYKDTVQKEQKITTKPFAEIEPTTSGHTISAEVTFNVDLEDYSGTTVGIYKESGCTTKVGDLQSASESGTFTFTNVPNGTYYVGIKTETDASVVKAVSDQITISDEGATLTDLSASVQGMKIYYGARFSSDATNGYTIGLYSDQDCSTSIGESVKNITGSSANYNYTVSTYQTCYIGVKTGGGELLGTTTARPNPVISFTTTGNQQIGYKIELSTMSPPNLKVWAIDYSSGALVGSNDLIPGSNEGSITVTDTNYHYRVFINDSQSYEDAYECIETSVYKFEGTTQYIWPAMPGEKVKADIKANWKYGYGTNLKASMYSDEACTTKVEGPYDVPASATGATVSFTNLENDSVTHMDYYYALFDGDISVTVFLVRVPPNPFTGVECIVSGNEITVNIESKTETFNRDYYCYLTESDGETTVYRVKLTDSDKKISSSITFETAEVEYDHDYKVIVSESSTRPSYPYWTTNVSTGSPPSDDEWVVAGSASMVVGHDVVTTGTLKSGLTPIFSYYSDEDREVPIVDFGSLKVDDEVYVKVTTNGNKQYNPFTDSTITFTVLDIASFNISGGSIVTGTITINVDNYSDYQWAAYHINEEPQYNDRIFYDITSSVVDVEKMEIYPITGDKQCQIEIWTKPKGDNPVCYKVVNF